MPKRSCTCRTSRTATTSFSRSDRPPRIGHPCEQPRHGDHRAAGSAVTASAGRRDDPAVVLDDHLADNDPRSRWSHSRRSGGFRLHHRRLESAREHLDALLDLAADGGDWCHRDRSDGARDLDTDRVDARLAQGQEMTPKGDDARRAHIRCELSH